MIIGASCRTRVIKHLSKMYKTIEEAEEALQIDYVVDMKDLTNEAVGHSTPARRDMSAWANVAEGLLSPMFSQSPNKNLSTSTTGDMVKDFISQTVMMTKRMKWQVLCFLYKQLVIGEGGPELASFIRPNFLDVSLKAMQSLLAEEKHNLIYNLCVCFERRDNDTLETRMPMNRMPFGLLDYNIRYFAANSNQKLGIEEHYAQWLETMFSHFGHKWLCLHRGPFWQYDVQDDNCDQDIPMSQLEQLETTGHLLNTEAANQTLVNTENVNQTLENTENVNETLEHPTNSLIADALADLHIDLDEFQSPPQSTANHSHVQESQLMCNSFNRKTVTNLWTSLSREESLELVEGGMSPEVMEQHHRIQPTKIKIPVNPAMYDPMKVTNSIKMV